MPQRATKSKAVSVRRISSADTLRDLIKSYRQKAAIGAKYYAQADAILDEIKERLAVNKRLPMGEGLFAVLVDRFGEEDKIWQPVAMKRFELQIQDATGKAVRMRDTKRGRK